MPYIVLSFFPRCGHCKKLKPEFEKASTVLKSNDPPVILAKVSLVYIYAVLYVLLIFAMVQYNIILY